MGEYVLYAALRTAVFLARLIPIRPALSGARCIGWVCYYLMPRRARKALLHLKLAFPEKSRRELKRLVRGVMVRMAQNIVEVLYLPAMDEQYIRRHVRMPEVSCVEQALREGHGVILLGCHAGSWELSNVACAAFFKDTPYAMLGRPQVKFRRLDGFLSRLRAQKGCQTISVKQGLRGLVRHLANNGLLGTVVDHGGRDGLPIPFFGKLAMTPVGTLKLASKLGSKVILAFMCRRGGPDHEIFFEGPVDLVSTGREREDFCLNLTRINAVFERWIRRHPQEYLWFYKRWKHSPQRNVLILNDGKLGHLKQSEALASLAGEVGFQIEARIVEVVYRSRFSRNLLSLCGLLFGPRLMRFCLGFCLDSKTLRELESVSCDLVVSAGSSLAPVNLAAAGVNDAKSIAIMKPGILGLGRFDLVVMPQHDRPRERGNVVPIVGSLNAVTSSSMREAFEELSRGRPALREVAEVKQVRVGLLLGGNSKNYTLTVDIVSFLCVQLLNFLEAADGLLLLTTSRRTPGAIVGLLKKDVITSPRCRFSVIAGEDNPGGTVEGIFYLSDILIVSGESISMVSEAAHSGKHVIVFEPRCMMEDNKVRRFLTYLTHEGYIHLVRPKQVYGLLETLARQKPRHPSLDTKRTILEALKKII